jgi:hypothetical protein
MITLFGRVLGRKNRLYLRYQREWLDWSRMPIGTFPSFEEWLATLASFTAITECAGQPRWHRPGKRSRITPWPVMRGEE